MKTSCIIFLLFASGFLSAQGEFNQWHFGDGAILDFSGGAPVASAGSAISTDEGSASIADAQGNLLFYTDGTIAWNKNHQPMPNGTGLAGHPSSSQSALILPVPGTSERYYLFTMNDCNSNGALRYSIVDMSLDNGLGDILPGFKNIFLGSDFTEKLVGASAECGLWVLVHKRESNAFHAFPVRPSGIGPAVISNVGTPHTTANGQTGATGVMKVSSDNQRIALATLTNILEVFDFDNGTGIVSGAVSIPVPSTQFSYGVCFSPSGQFLYAGEADPMQPAFNTLFQYDLSSGTSAGIAATKTAVGTPGSPSSVVFDAQLGPDGKIYVARYLTDLLDVIASPDNPGAACGYISGGVVLPPQERCRMGLPNQPRFPQNLQPDLADLGNDTLLCPGTTLTLQDPGAGPWLWSDGSTGSSITVSATGVYWLQVGTGDCADRDSVTVTVENPAVNAGPDVTVCAGNPVTLTASGAAGYTWSGGITDGVAFIPTASQSYTVTGTSAAGCTATDAVTVTVETPPSVQFSADVLSGCLPLQVSFQAAATTPGSTFIWNFGDGSAGIGPTPLHVYNGAGCHDVSLTITSPAGCPAAVTLPGYICSFIVPTASFTFDPLLLGGSLTTVSFTNTSENASSWTWDFGDQLSSADASPVHTYQPSADGYEILLTAFNSNGCQDTASAFIPANNGPTFYVPNAFTPDGNEFNQVFLPVFTSGFDPARYSFQVFNRWGELLFESLDYRTGWDGSSTTGTLVPDGVYTWKVYYSPPDTDERIEVTGHVVLVR